MSEITTLMKQIILPSLWQTIYMIIISTILSFVIGFILAIVLAVTDERGIKPNKIIYGILSTIINVLRSVPFIILAVAIIPFTRSIVGTSIGENAAIVPFNYSFSTFYS